MRAFEQKFKKLLLAVCIIPLLLSGNFLKSMAADNASAEADTGTVPTACDNLTVHLRKYSKLVATQDGYMRVFFDGEKIRIEYFDDDFNLLSKKSLSLELDIYGGFYASNDAYYIAEGKTNKEELDTNEVIRIIKYDKDWTRKGAAIITSNTNLFGGEVRYPFDYGCVEFAEKDGTLYMVTGHEGYVDPTYNQGHQGFLMVAVNEQEMTGEIVDCDLWHSFAQYIENVDNNLYVLEQSEGSRYTKLSKYDGSKDKYWDTLSSTSINVLQYGGARDSAWAIACYASVDDMAASSKNILCLGTSIDQADYENLTENTAHNIYLTVTPIDNFTKDATTVKWLTSYADDASSFLGVNITKINDNKFMVAWEEYQKSGKEELNDGLSGSVLHYVFIDGNGDKISEEFTAAAPISDCKPIVKGSNIVYYASNANMVNFYTIDSATGKFGKKVYRIAGENATWDIDKGTLTISGKGAMKIDSETHYRYPLSYVSGSYIYNSGDNSWTAIRESVTKIIIKKGITSIPDSAFANFDKLKEVIIEDGVKSIGEKAFYGCDSIEKVYIPASVTSIGEDILWTGYFWTSDGSHVMKGTICAPSNSYAASYAKKYYISCLTDISGAKISGLKSKYAYNGNAQTPEFSLSIGGTKLVTKNDFYVTYKNNKKTGKATVTITGTGNYSGTITKTFLIIPKKATISKLSSPKAKTLQIKWKKDSQASGYQLQYALDKKFKKGKKTINIAKNITVSKKLAKLKKGKKYYIRIRAYKTISGGKKYGAWSKVKSVKCK